MKYRNCLSAVVLLASISTSVAAQHNPGNQDHKRVTMKQLPKSHHRVVHGGNPYYFWGGHFYRHSGGVYVSITAPIGAIIPALPGGFITIGTGPGRYHYYAGVYYRPLAKGYEVVEPPSDPPEILPMEEASGRIIVYPAAGQSEEQTGRDRYECHLWANRETGFDPTSTDSNASLKDDYSRALSACLEARDYVVK
ncbi:MAG: DUF6515 family protein [Haliea sp.]|uniref:DUF6515 family protein n=1 Tax=Haliea sp. TaxID=1932666 RepID=UPI0032EC25A2